MNRFLTKGMGRVYLASACLGLAAGCASTGYEGARPGDVRAVSTEVLPLFAAPDGLSAHTKELAYQDRVTVQEVVKVAPPFTGNRELFPEFLLPCWLKVLTNGSTGYLPSGALVSEWLIGNQNPQERITSDGMCVAKRGFSEDEDMELATMRGAAGAGNYFADADFDLLDKLYVELRSTAPTMRDVKQFLSDGAFKAHVVKQEKVPVESRSAFASFGNALRQTTADVVGGASEIVGQNNGAVSQIGKAGAGMMYSEVGPVQEFQVGESVAAKVLPAYAKEGRKILPLSDPRSVYVRKLAAALAGASNNPMPYRGLSVILCESDEVNAFAIPGGFLIVTTGMLEFLNDEDELAAIIGHEIGHLELSHGMRAVGTEKFLKIFSLLKDIGASSLEGNSLKTLLQDLIDDAFGQMTTNIRNGYGIETESQADWRSLQLCNRLGYDTKALYDVLERFKAKKGSYGGASYPAERGADILKYREQFGYAGQAAGRATRAARYKAVIKK